MSALRSYEDIVSTFRKRGTREMITNGSALHAAVLLRNILILAAEKRLPVRIYSGALAPSVYDQLVEQAKRVLAVTKMQVVCDERPAFGNAFAEMITESPNGSLSVLFSRLGSHFVLAGDVAYRVEVDHDACEAIGNFNDVAMGRRLNSIFDDLLSSSVTYDGAAAQGAELLQAN